MNLAWYLGKILSDITMLAIEKVSYVNNNQNKYAKPMKQICQMYLLLSIHYLDEIVAVSDVSSEIFKYTVVQNFRSGIC